MSTEDNAALSRFERLIGEAMPTALDMIGTVVDDPQMDLDDYSVIVGVSDDVPWTLFLAMLRAAAGLAAIAEMTGDQVRALAP